MSPRGRSAVLPPAGHCRPEALASGGLVVRHYNAQDQVKDYDFSALPVSVPMQHTLAGLFAAWCVPGIWSAHTTSGLYWGHLRRFCAFLSHLETPVTGIDEITPAVIKRWRLSQPDTLAGRNAITYVSRLLKGDARLSAGPVAEELARRGKPARSRLQSYSEAEFGQITTAARRMFRAAVLRIEENAAHLQRFRDGQFAAGSRDFVIGEALDCLARTGDLPKYDALVGAGKVVAQYARALGGTRAEATWQRLFLSRHEAVALAVLLLAEYGWNLSVINRQEVPQATPDPGADGRRTYRILLEKRRRGKGHWYETRNVTDDGAASNGRLITQALAATRFARAIVEELAPGTDLLIVWRTNSIGRYQQDQDRPPPVGQFRFGVQSHDAAGWARESGLAGSPFQRGRRTVIAVDRREPAQHSQDTHDRHYALADHRVQDGAAPVIAAGAQEAADRARQAVLAAQLRPAPDPGDAQTATADCSGTGNAPVPDGDGGCAASFLMCLACPNAHIHPGHHPRLVHLHHALASLRTIQPAPTWAADWGDAHARLEDLRHRIGEGAWRQARTRITDADRALIGHLLNGDLG